MYPSTISVDLQALLCLTSLELTDIDTCWQVKSIELPSKLEVFTFLGFSLFLSGIKHNLHVLPLLTNRPHLTVQGQMSVYTRPHASHSYHWVYATLCWQVHSGAGLTVIGQGAGMPKFTASDASNWSAGVFRGVVVETEVRTSLKVDILLDTLMSTARVELKYVVVCVSGRHLCHAPAVPSKFTGIAYFMAHRLSPCACVITRSVW